MDGEEIRSLLASVAAPAEMPIPVPPNMSAVPAAPVLDAGADPAEVEAWVRSVLGWPKRVPLTWVESVGGHEDRTIPVAGTRRGTSAVPKPVRYYVVPEVALTGDPA